MPRVIRHMSPTVHALCHASDSELSTRCISLAPDLTTCTFAVNVLVYPRLCIGFSIIILYVRRYGHSSPHVVDHCRVHEVSVSVTRTTRSGLEETMDELNMFLMHIHGITPEMAAERRQREIERKERVAQEASRSKVMEWRNHLDIY